jgi:predicted ATP-grasp superfamily ATP-dependent carboligase
MKESIAGTKALVTDVDRRKSLSIIQALGRAGVRVTGLSYERLPVGWFSKYCHRVHLVPDYRSKPDLFLEALEHICSAGKPDVFYPIEDEVVALCSKNRSTWQPYCRALIPSSGALEQAYDKLETISAARKLGIPVPDTFCPGSLEEARSIAQAWQGEAVIKPRKSSGSRGIVYVDGPDAILSAYREVSGKYDRPLIQERITPEGSGLGAFALIDEHKQVRAIFGHRRLREYPISGGPSTLCVSHRDDRLIEQSIALFKEIGLVGAVMAEYKVDARTETPILMEINPRFWGSLQLAIYAGVNFPVLYHKAAMGLPFDPILDYPLDRYWRWLIPGDIMHFLSNPQRFRLKPSFFRISHRNTSYDMARDDLFPVVGMFITGLRKILLGNR